MVISCVRRHGGGCLSNIIGIRNGGYNASFLASHPIDNSEGVRRSNIGKTRKFFMRDVNLG